MVKVLGFIAWVMMAIGVLAVTIGGAAYGASFFFEFDSEAAVKLFDAGGSTTFTAMVLVMWCERSDR